MAPIAKRWRDLTVEEKSARLDVAEDLLWLIRWNRGHPWNTAWEEQFLASIEHQIVTFGGKAGLTVRQMTVLRQLFDKLDADPDEVESGPDDEDEC